MHASPKATRQILEQNFLQILVEGLRRHEEHQLLKVCLTALGKIFKRTRRTDDRELVLCEFERIGGIDLVETL